MDDEAPHGPAFYSVCKTNGIDAAPRGTPGANKISATNHIVEKVQRLLALTKSSNEGEARNAADAAHHLMLKYNIALQEKNEERGYTTRCLGGLTGRIQKWTCELANILSKFYFVEVIWMNNFDPRTKKDGFELEVSGTEENVEVVEFVHEFLYRSALEAWDRKLEDSILQRGTGDSFPQNLYASWRSAHSERAGCFCPYQLPLGFYEGFQGSANPDGSQRNLGGPGTGQGCRAGRLLPYAPPSYKSYQTPGWVPKYQRTEPGVRGRQRSQVA